MLEIKEKLSKGDLNGKYYQNILEKDLKATVRRTDHLYEVLWQGESVGSYQTEEEAEMVAENYALGSAISRT